MYSTLFSKNLCKITKLDLLDAYDFYNNISVLHNRLY